MRYLLDTTVVIPFLAGDQTVVDLVGRLAVDGIAVSILSYLEVWQGTFDAPDAEDVERRVTEFFALVPLLTVDVAVARRCAGLRAMLSKQGKNPRRRSFDLVIAATALEHNLVLVTHNVRDFADIPDLELRHP